ncbi:hypothetical protein GCM10017044_26350 [Kordiimonas sediminis]|uniref:Glycine zipper domain-containing protein n=1 Tax=Kordiimonas sediminis TaxID=1735581 RepID=A0A919AXG7_9PROT|nr:glycine zipper domain-containing protein [Kordiimonas sediminis]GHF29802.1 hypothetical protein GCM10017044_26350 [Kordiimonas sediminis]
MNGSKLRYLALVPALLLVGACTSQSLSPGHYDSRSVGRVQSVERGVIESYRWVEIDGKRGVGSLAGAGIGAAAGSTVGDNAVGVIGAIGGALIGSAIGDSIDKKNAKTSGFEYLIRTEKGDLVTIVQADAVPLGNNAPVMIYYGDRARVVLDESRIVYEHEKNPDEFYSQ